MIRRPPRSTQSRSSAASDVYKRQVVCGMALYYISYSTWRGRCLYLEDLYIQPEYRRGGLGQDLFNKLLGEAKELGVKRMDWQVLEWNEPAIKFYEKIGADLD